jgi:hypothetical protein
MYLNQLSHFRSSPKAPKRPTFLELLTASKKKIPLSKFMSITKAKRYCLLIFFRIPMIHIPDERRLSLVWVNYTWRSTLNECDGNTIRTVLLENPGLPSERPSCGVPIFHLHIKSKREEQVNLPKLQVSSNRWNWTQKLERMLGLSQW